MPRIGIQTAFGLDPIVRQSDGRHVYTGHISHAGEGHVRGLLVQAALGAIRGLPRT